MNEREQAKELIEKFYNVKISDTAGQIGFMTIEMATQCALICVGKIIEQMKILPVTFYPRSAAINYWQAVKTEIQNFEG